MRVFVVQHVHEGTDSEDVKFIGVYSSRSAAELAINRLKLVPGFEDTPEGFVTDEYLMDVDNWSEGYETLVDD